MISGLRGSRRRNWHRTVNLREYDGEQCDMRLPLGTPGDMAADKPCWVPSLGPEGRLQVHIRCAWCGQIGDIAGHRISAHGYVSQDCVLCPGCGNGHYYELGDWPGRLPLIERLKEAEAKAWRSERKQNGKRGKNGHKIKVQAR